MTHLLVAVDGSPIQDLVFQRALALAKGTGARLTLFRAVATPTELPKEAFAVSPNDLPAILLARAQADLASLAARVPAGSTAVRAEVGTPWRAVVDAAARERADLIVIGSHGHGGIDRLLGTTAAKIVDHATCSVLVVKPDAAPSAASDRRTT